MRAITGDLGRMQDEWGLSLGFASEVSALASLQHTVAESLSIPFMVEQRFCTVALMEEKNKKKHNKKETWLLQCLLSFSAGNRPMALLKQQHHTPWVK